MRGEGGGGGSYVFGLGWACEVVGGEEACADEASDGCEDEDGDLEFVAHGEDEGVAVGDPADDEEEDGDAPDRQEGVGAYKFGHPCCHILKTNI